MKITYRGLSNALTKYFYGDILNTPNLIKNEEDKVNMENNNKIKGVSARMNKKGVSYEAYVTVKNSGKRSTRTFKAHVGTFPTMEAAMEARAQFICNLR